MALTESEPLRLCDACDGRAYGGVRLRYPSEGSRSTRTFPVDLGSAGRCSRCKGSGFDNATVREAFEREQAVLRASGAEQSSLPV